MRDCLRVDRGILGSREDSGRGRDRRSCGDSGALQERAAIRLARRLSGKTLQDARLFRISLTSTEPEPGSIPTTARAQSSALQVDVRIDAELDAVLEVFAIVELGILVVEN